VELCRNFILIGLGLAALRGAAAEVNVFAAASLTDSLKAIAADYQRQSGDKIVLNLAASSTLARQIENGAPADIFFSADDAGMDALERQGLIVKASRQDRLSNSLVIVVAADSAIRIDSAADLASAKIHRIALGDPRAVPIGVYAREYLEKLNLWQKIKPKVVPTENVRAALAAVESGDADASIVYQTDAAISKKVKVALAVPPGEGPRISYPMALVKGSRHPEAAAKFFAYLGSEAAGKVFKQYGFIVLEPQKGR
jgi:molybdate transport system substrate-binding protein